MGYYLLRKLGQTIAILLGATSALFLLFHVVGGDPAYLALGRYATAQQIADFHHAYGLDRPLYIQFLEYLRQIVTLDFGRSISGRQDIGLMLRSGIEPSLSLAVPAFILTTLTSLGVALFAAYFRGRWLDRLVIVICVLGMSVPMLAYIIFGQYFIAYRLGWFPISGYEASWPERAYFLALPVLIWVAVNVGYQVRFFRTAITEETERDYVRTARAKGLAEPFIFAKHILKNSMIPILTSIVIQVPFLILGSFLLESFFGIPGLGDMTVEAIRNSDFAVLKAMTTLIAFLYIIGNFATDIFYTLFDPRVKLR